MTKSEFVLTVRPDDLREVYRDRLTYRFTSSGSLPTFLLMCLFLILSIIAISKISSNDEYLFLSLCFLLGLGYQAIQFLKHYLQFKEGAKEVEKWIDTTKSYASHCIHFDEKGFRYLRDKEISVFELNSLKRTYRRDDHFYFMTTGNMDIVLPKKSFEPGDYERFLNCFDEILKSKTA